MAGPAKPVTPGSGETHQIADDDHPTLTTAAGHSRR